MTAEKDSAFILTMQKFRESSAIATLYSQRYGLLKGVAKGIRKTQKKSRNSTVIERGMLVELVVYFKPTRELQTLTNIQVIDFFPSVRIDLFKSALRDLAVEIVIRGMRGNEHSPQLFSCLSDFFSTLDSIRPDPAFPLLIWDFILAFSEHSGFKLTVDRCAGCRDELTDSAYMHIEQGGFLCPRCESKNRGGILVPTAAMHYLQKRDTDRDKIKHSCSTAELRTITHLLASYCRYHFDIQARYRTLEFIDELFGT
jgi:DNA repair protein RecO (recombination protein O)